MFCLTDSFQHRERADALWTPYKSDSSFCCPLVTFYAQLWDLWQVRVFYKSPSGLRGATSLSSKGSHMVWEIGTRSWRASVKALLGIETISIGLHYNSSDTVSKALSQMAHLPVLSLFENKTVGRPICNFMVQKGAPLHLQCALLWNTRPLASSLWFTASSC